MPIKVNADPSDYVGGSPDSWMPSVSKEDSDISILGNMFGESSLERDDLKNPSADTSMQLLLELIKGLKSDTDPAQLAALLQTYMQRGFDLDARNYNSVTSQIERLMSAGMSRTQALLTATAGEATPTQVADLASAAGSDADRALSKQQYAIDTAFNAVGSFANFFTGNYGAMVNMIGDSLVKDIGTEIYSWLPRGIEIPEQARADAESFKRWCLGMLTDENDNVIEPPQEARDLINSKAWQRMASRPSGWLAFERYFNANYSTRGYHEDLQDAKRIRKLNELSVVSARMQQYLNLPALYDATLDMAMADLQGISLTINADIVQGAISTNDTSVLFDDSGVTRVLQIPDSGNITSVSQHYFFNEDGTLRDDLPQQLRLLIQSLAHDTYVANCMATPNYLLQVGQNIFESETLKGIMMEADSIVQSYRTSSLKDASASQMKSSNPIIELLQNLLTNYMLMTGGRSFIDDASSVVGFGESLYFKNKALHGAK